MHFVNFLCIVHNVKVCNIFLNILHNSLSMVKVSDPVICTFVHAFAFGLLGVACMYCVACLAAFLPWGLWVCVCQGRNII
jgi:hypothetical protein